MIGFIYVLYLGYIGGLLYWLHVSKGATALLRIEKASRAEHGLKVIRAYWEKGLLGFAALTAITFVIGFWDWAAWFAALASVGEGCVSSLGWILIPVDHPYEKHRDEPDFVRTVGVSRLMGTFILPLWYGLGYAFSSVFPLLHALLELPFILKAYSPEAWNHPTMERIWALPLDWIKMIVMAGVSGLSLLMIFSEGTFTLRLFYLVTSAYTALHALHYHFRASKKKAT